jgi:hypothetical protein
MDLSTGTEIGQRIVNEDGEVNPFHAWSRNLPKLPGITPTFFPLSIVTVT